MYTRRIDGILCIFQLLQVPKHRVYFCSAASALRSRKERERAGAGYSFGILLSVREAEARVLYVPHC